MRGFLRQDGRIGIRNRVLVIYLGEAMRRPARDMTRTLGSGAVEMIGFFMQPTNHYVATLLERCATHPNIGSVLILEAGASDEGMRLAEAAKISGRMVHHLDCRAVGGVVDAVTVGGRWLGRAIDTLRAERRVPLHFSDLTIGTICGGSDSTSALSANPAIGLVYDRLVAGGATAIFEETGELIGCDLLMAERAATPDVARAILAAMAKAVRHFDELGHGSFAPGNADGGLTTIEEKSLGAYAKSGSSPINGVILPGQLPEHPGLHLMDKIPDGPLRYGYSDATDNVGVAEMIGCGAQLVLFSTGRGSVVGSAVAPVIKICANPETFRRLSEDMDVDAGRILEGRGTLAEVADELYRLILRVASGEESASERLGHREFILMHKAFAKPPSRAS
jgi:altronate dehydratase large subunit